MEVLDNILKKMGAKKPKPVVINITDLSTKSCGNCNHYHRTASLLDKCMHYPAACINEVNTKVCTPNERKYWAPKERGLFGRFFHWLF